MGGGPVFPAWCPFFSLRSWTPAKDCWNLCFSLGHRRGDNSYTWCVDACGVAMAGWLVVTHVPVSCGVSLLSSVFSWARALPTMTGSVWGTMV